MHCLLTSTVPFLGAQTNKKVAERSDLPLPLPRPHQALLYLKHPDHLADCIRVEPVIPFASSLPQVQGNFFVRFLGKWQEYDMQGHSAPVGGLEYVPLSK